MEPAACLLMALLCVLALEPEPATSVLFSHEPGFRVMVTKKGLDYGIYCVYMPILQDSSYFMHFVKCLDPF